jgi:hypothetical protein
MRITMKPQQIPSRAGQGTMPDVRAMVCPSEANPGNALVRTIARLAQRPTEAHDREDAAPGGHDRFALPARPRVKNERAGLVVFEALDRIAGRR